MKPSKRRRRRSESDRRLRAYYDETSSLAGGRSIKRVALSFPRPRRLVALRLEQDTIDALRLLAQEKGLNYSTLMRMWITERLRREGYPPSR